MGYLLAVTFLFDDMDMFIVYVLVLILHYTGSYFEFLIMRSLVKFSLGKRFICDNFDASNIKPAINFPRPIKRAKEPNESRTVPIIER